MPVELPGHAVRRDGLARDHPTYPYLGADPVGVAPRRPHPRLARHAQLLGTESSSAEVRGARLAALQTALVKASAEEGFRRTLVFHHVVKEAEAFAASLPNVAAQLHASDRELYSKTVWADWLCGEHKPLHRRRVLAEFAEGIATDGTVVEKRSPSKRVVAVESSTRRVKPVPCE